MTYKELEDLQTDFMYAVSKRIERDISKMGAGDYKLDCLPTDKEKNISTILKDLVGINRNKGIDDQITLAKYYTNLNFNQFVSLVNKYIYG